MALIATATTKERLEALINKFYFSTNYFINADNKAENKVNGKILGEVKITNKNKFQYHV